MDIQVIELENGLRVAYKAVPYTRTVHCGYTLNIGSRDDGDHAGIAHFVEHMIFKGTAKRKTYHILNYLESVGADVNAYTTKEKTCVYASLPSDYAERATELLTDIVFNSIFPEKEIAKEQQVISEEIDSYRDSPDEAIFEDFDTLIFPNHILGVPILGTKESIRDLTQDVLIQQMRRSCTQGNVVYAIVGNITEKEVRKIIDKHLRHLVLPTGSLTRLAPQPLLTTTHSTETSGSQAHEIIGGRAYSFHDTLYHPFWLLTNLLGGASLNSRLNLNIREKYGLAYSISAFFSPFIDSGQWGIYYGCEPESLPRVRKLVYKELRNLREVKLSTAALHSLQKQSVGQLILSHESLLSQMLAAGKDLLDYGKAEELPEAIAHIESVTASQVLEAANEIFAEENLSCITYLADSEE